MKTAFAERAFHAAARSRREGLITMINQLLLILLSTTLYAVVRYCGFGGVSLIHVPVYVMNKAISMAAAVSLLMASMAVARSRREATVFWSKACTHLAFIHVLLSLAILSKGYFANFFANDKMSLTGETTVLFGAMAAYCIWRLNSRGLKSAEWRFTTAAVYALVAGHLFVMGYDGWLQVQKWNGGLPPITLLSFLFVVYGLMTFLRSKDVDLKSLPDESNIEPAIEP
jgi:hypothetical protein